MSLKKVDYDNELYNTRLLLMNYTKFKQHVNNATHSADEIEIIENKFLEYEMTNKPDTYINSILRTKERTRIMIAHIDKLIEVYKKEAIENKDMEQLDRYKIIYYRYIAKDKKTMVKLSLELNMSERNVFRIQQRAIKDLSVLFFGIDAIDITS